MTTLAPPHSLAAPRRDALAQGVMTAVVLCAVFVQKIGFPLAGGTLELGVVILLAAALALTLSGAAGLDAARLGLFALFCAAVFISQLLVGRPVSAPSVLLMLALYLPAVLTVRMDENRWRAMVAAFIAAMGVIAAIVIAQHVAQRLWGVGVWPNLNALLPDPVLTPGYNYYRETRWHSGVYQPNGVFMLEPAVASQFLAVALACEATLFGRLSRMALLAAGLVLTMAGTGLLILAATAPFLLARLRPRALGSLLAVAAGAALVGAATGWLNQLAARAGEVFQPGTSGYIRYAQPFMDIIHRAADPISLITGDGAGATPIDPNNNSLPFSKLIGEYGFAAAAAFYAFFAFVLFVGAPRLRIAVVLAALHLLGGGSLSVASYVSLILVLGAWPRLDDTPTRQAA